MKPFVVAALLAVVFACSEAQQKKGGKCPANNSFGICTFDPSQNCLDDSACQGGQLCCQDGCNRVCKEPQYDDQPGLVDSPPSSTVRQCPRPSGNFGICVYDENVNCLSDDQCHNGQMCCSEGCNKVCKDPVTFQPLKSQPKSNVRFS